MNTERAIERLTNVYEDFLNNRIPTSVLEKKIGECLRDIGPGRKTFNVGIVKTTYSEEFFGMRIFPVASELDVIAAGITEEDVSFEKIYDKWKSIDAWYVEIDSDIFSKIISFNPRELTAMTLHELGHVVYSDKPLERFYRAYKENYIRMHIATKASDALLYRLYSIPLAVACTMHTIGSGKNGINAEIYADKYVIESGYGEDLGTALGKIIEQYGNNTRYTKEENINDAELQTSVKWASLNIDDMTKRKNDLKFNTFVQAIKMKSGYMLDLCHYVMNLLGTNLRENYTSTVVESITLEEACDPDFENKYSITFDPKFKVFECSVEDARQRAVRKAAMESSRNPEIPSQLDIDLIAVEVDKMTNHHDRMYVLDLIYNKIDDIERFRDLFEYNRDLKRKYDDKTKRMLDQLESLRSTVLSKRVFNNNGYKLYVKYPEGYEG